MPLGLVALLEAGCNGLLGEVDRECRVCEVDRYSSLRSALSC